MEGFIRRAPGFEMPERLGMISDGADLELRPGSPVAIGYVELFGHTRPDWYDEDGNALWDRVR